MERKNITNGPDHYRAACRLLANEKNEYGMLALSEHTPTVLLFALVHALCANAAATALADGGADNGMPTEDYSAWMSVAGVPGTENGAAGGDADDA